PSMVVISAPLATTAKVRQELTRRPSRRTVQAPHWPWSQPFLLPVSSKCSRRASRSEVRVSRVRVCGVPLTLRVRVMVCGVVAAAMGQDGVKRQAVTRDYKGMMVAFLKAFHAFRQGDSGELN